MCSSPTARAGSHSARPRPTLARCPRRRLRPCGACRPPRAWPMELLANILISAMIAATPLLMAATGELVAERSGVLNLGVEGMMIVGAIAGFSTVIATKSAALALAAAIASGAVMAALFGVLVLTLRANQVASGL